MSLSTLRGSRDLPCGWGEWTAFPGLGGTKECFSSKQMPDARLGVCLIFAFPKVFQAWNLPQGFTEALVVP
jgi:hypothetical protein